MRLVEEIVDRLPARLWRIGNLYMLPGGDWHFCVKPHRQLGRSVRTVEWRGHELARGRRRTEVTGDADDSDGIGEWVSLWRWGYYPGRD